jgi:hypothetical protein
VLVRVTQAIELHVAESLLGVSANALQFWRAVDGVHGQAEAIDLIFDGQFHRRVDIALLFVPAHLKIVVICAPIRQFVNEPGITVEIEDYRAIHGKERIEFAVA